MDAEARLDACIAQALMALGWAGPAMSMRSVYDHALPQVAWSDASEAKVLAYLHPHTPDTSTRGCLPWPSSAWAQA